MKKANKSKILKFLEEVKEILIRRNPDSIPRRKNRETLIRLGITIKEQRNIIMSLSLTNYAAGPKKDLDKPGELWEFGTEISGYEIYIKLKITEIDGEKIVKCISFHEADRPLNYPFR